jgi:type II secretion system protein C
MMGALMLRSSLLTKRNIFYLNILISIILLFSLLFLIRDIVSGHFEKRTLKREKPASTGGITAQQKKQLEDYASISKNNPFGFPGGEIKNLTVSAGSKIQKTDIVLVGTVVGPKELSYGVFKDSSGTQEVFKIGEPVFGAGKLRVVKKDRVILKRGDGSVEIPLEDVKVKEITKQSSGSTPSADAFARKVGRGNYIVDQAKLQQAISNPGQMMTDARLRPNLVNGKEEGFVLNEVKPGGIYHSLGLQDGDVLLRINEYDVSNPERALQAFTALKGMERVQIDMIRSGAKMTMTYQIK